MYRCIVFYMYCITRFTYYRSSPVLFLAGTLGPIPRQHHPISQFLVVAEPCRPLLETALLIDRLAAVLARGGELTGHRARRPIHSPETSVSSRRRRHERHRLRVKRGTWRSTRLDDRDDDSSRGRDHLGSYTEREPARARGVGRMMTSDWKPLSQASETDSSRLELCRSHRT